MFRLPVSGLPVVFEQPTGFEDLLLREAHALDTALALAIIGRLVRVPDHPEVVWDELTVTDIEALLLLLRRRVLGDAIRAEARCGREACGAQADVSFSIDSYLGSQRIRAPRQLQTTEREGWFRLSGEDLKFRLPNGADLALIERARRPELEMVRRCVEPPDAPARMRRRAERAMEAMAPLLSRTLSGECPECHGAMEIYFDVQSFVLSELRNMAAGVYQDVHLLALHYKWPEEKILALPWKRRVRYVELIRSQGAAA